jgi:hypothetical protein
MNAFRIILAFAVFFSQFRPLVRWRWHEVILIGGLSIFALDWFVGVHMFNKRMKPIAFAAGVYCAGTVAGLVLSTYHGPRIALEIVAALVVVAALVALVLAMRIGRSTTELDRLIFSEASSISFFATMIALITVALIDSWLGYRAPTPWVFAFVGAATWVIARAVVRSRYR